MRADFAGITKRRLLRESLSPGPVKGFVPGIPWAHCGIHPRVGRARSIFRVYPALASRRAGLLAFAPSALKQSIDSALSDVHRHSTSSSRYSGILATVLLVDDLFNLSQVVEIMPRRHLGHVMDSLFPALLMHSVVIPQCFWDRL